MRHHKRKWAIYVGDKVKIHDHAAPDNQSLSIMKDNRNDMTQTPSAAARFLDPQDGTTRRAYDKPNTDNDNLISSRPPSFVLESVQHYLNPASPIVSVWSNYHDMIHVHEFWSICITSSCITSSIPIRQILFLYDL